MYYEKVAVVDVLSGKPDMWKENTHGRNQENSNCETSSESSSSESRRYKDSRSKDNTGCTCSKGRACSRKESRREEGS